MVRALFLAAFDASEPFPQIMSQALQRSYEECGWDPLTGAGRATRRAARRADAGPAAGGRARRDRRRRLRPGAAGRHAGLRRRPAAVAADRLGRPVLRGRSPGGHRRAAGPERRAGARGRGQRRGQGVRDRHAASSGSSSTCGCAPRRHQPARRTDGLRHVIVLEEAHRLLRAGRTGRQRARGRAVRRAAGRDPRLRRGCRDRRADPGQARAGRDQEHRAQGAAPAAGRGRPAARRRHDEPGRRPVAAGGLAAAGRGGGLRRRHGPADAGPGPVRRRPAARARCCTAAATAAGRPPVERPAGGRAPASGPARWSRSRAADLLARSAAGRLAAGLGRGLRAGAPGQPAPAAGTSAAAAALGRAWTSGCGSACWPRLSTRAVLGRGPGAARVLRPRPSWPRPARYRPRAMLDGGKGAGTRPGTSWVIPQLQLAARDSSGSARSTARRRTRSPRHRRWSTRCPTWPTGRT